MLITNQILQDFHDFKTMSCGFENTSRISILFSSLFSFAFEFSGHIVVFFDTLASIKKICVLLSRSRHPIRGSLKRDFLQAQSP